MAIGDIIVGLDLGVSKVSCVIGQVNKFNEIEVIGYGLANNSGIKRGRILDPQSVANAIKESVTSAEQISELSVKSAYVNIKGMNVRIEKVVMDSAVERPDDGLTINDVYAAYSKIQIATHLEKNEQIRIQQEKNRRINLFNRKKEYEEIIDNNKNDELEL